MRILEDGADHVHSSLASSCPDIGIISKVSMVVGHYFVLSNDLNRCWFTFGVYQGIYSVTQKILLQLIILLLLLMNIYNWSWGWWQFQFNDVSTSKLMMPLQMIY